MIKACLHMCICGNIKSWHTQERIFVWVKQPLTWLSIVLKGLMTQDICRSQKADCFSKVHTWRWHLLPQSKHWLSLLALLFSEGTLRNNLMGRKNLGPENILIILPCDKIILSFWHFFFFFSDLRKKSWLTFSKRQFFFPVFHNLTVV